MKTARILASAILCLFLLSCYSYMVSHVARGGQNLGVFTQPIKAFSEFPKQIFPVLNYVFSPRIPPSYVELSPEISPSRLSSPSLPYPLFGLMSFWEKEKGTWAIRLIDFQHDSLKKEWTLPQSFFEPTPSFLFNSLSPYTKNFEEARPLHSLMNPDSSLIISLHEGANLLKLDAQSNLLWKNSDFIFHHAMNRDFENTLWLCASPHLESKQGKNLGKIIKDINGNTFHYRDDLIVQVDQQTGKTLFFKSVSDILFENRLQHLFLGSMLGPDPLHLNDIEPTLDSTRYWNRGDLFLSLRHQSLILQYRPSTNQVIRSLQGPFLFQHDIDIQTEGILSIFNNNTFEAYESTNLATDEKIPTHFNHSEILLYNLADHSVQKLCDSVLDVHQVVSASEGLHEILGNGDILIEAQNQGRILILNEKVLVWEKSFFTGDMRYMNLLNWVRVIEPDSLKIEPS